MRLTIMQERTFKLIHLNRVIGLRFVGAFHQKEDEHDPHLPANHDKDVAGVRELQSAQRSDRKAISGDGRIPAKLLQGHNGKVATPSSKKAQYHKIQQEGRRVHPAS